MKRSTIFVSVILGTITSCSAQLISILPTLFNHGRNVTFTGTRGLSFSTDNKTLYYAGASSEKKPGQPFPLKIFETTWSNGGWSIAKELPLTGFDDNYPLISSDGNRLYFASTAPAPGHKDGGDYNIWYVERINNGWGDPIYYNKVNSEGIDYPMSIANGIIYFGSNGRGGEGGIDVFSFHLQNEGVPAPIPALNSVHDDFISVAPTDQFAFLVRFKFTQNGQFDRSVLLFSTKKNGIWSPPQELDFTGNEGYLAYPISSVCISPNLGRLYFVNAYLIWSFSINELIKTNGLTPLSVVDTQPLPTKKLADHEREVFEESFLMRSSNGIAFADNGRTIYTARFTDQYDSAFSGRLMRIYESHKSGKQWSVPKLASFVHPLDNKVVFHEYHPYVTHDQKRIYYNVQIYKSGDAMIMTPNRNHLWYVDKKEDGTFGSPVALNEINKQEHEDSYASVTKSGTIYFKSNRRGGIGKNDFWVFDQKNKTIKPLKELNTEFNENDIYVDPEERFIVFNRYYSSGSKEGEIELLISFKKGNEWTKPRILEGVEKQIDWELSPVVAPDLEYIYFESGNVIMRQKFKPLLTLEEIKLLK